VDLLEEKGISWAAYQENMPCNGYAGFKYVESYKIYNCKLFKLNIHSATSFSTFNYLNTSSSVPLTLYFRKNNPFVSFESVMFNPNRAKRLRNFNDFAADVRSDRLPSYVMITPNIQNDGHDSPPSFLDQWIEYFVLPLLVDPHFNTAKTLIMLTYDEDDSLGNNQVYTLLLGNGVPKHLRGTQDSTYHTHFSVLSTLQSNWHLNCLGRQDTNK
jgi:phospholipase C